MYNGSWWICSGAGTTEPATLWAISHHLHAPLASELICIATLSANNLVLLEATVAGAVWWVMGRTLAVREGPIIQQQTLQRYKCPLPTIKYDQPTAKLIVTEVTEADSRTNGHQLPGIHINLTPAFGKSAQYELLHNLLLSHPSSSLAQIGEQPLVVSMAKNSGVAVCLALMLTLAMVSEVRAACTASSMYPCVDSSKNINSAVTSDCCAAVKSMQSQGASGAACLCTLAFSALAKQFGVNGDAAMAIPLKCHLPVPRGYKCQGTY